MEQPVASSSRRDDRVDVGWRGSAVAPKRRKIIHMPGGSGSATAALRRQAEEQPRLGLDAGAAGAGGGLQKLAPSRTLDPMRASNPGVAARIEQDNAARLTDQDRERILERKAQTYAALKPGFLARCNSSWLYAV
ncbi:hypothetical protein WJX73_006893 [Symbiochloris irregularis]|uniref:Uncharacterized protein n=1 Tax=Symbiochloris irregularis TaxID=706552 RepID=A0AAW1NZ04_9CHLO